MRGIYGKAVFGTIFVVLFIAGMQMINGWQMDVVTWCSIPVILCAECIVFGMLYATIYHGMEHEEKTTEPAEKTTIAQSEQRRAA